jgi:integral membrane protein (TIGR01906 family)
MPFFLGFSTVRLIINGAEVYLNYEYRKADFPQDLQQYTQLQQQQLGLTPLSVEQRMELASVAVKYLQRPEPAEEVIYLLEEQRLPRDGAGPLYNAEEISHMIDVKNLTDIIARLNWILGGIVIVGIVALVARPSTRAEGYRALFYGGVATTLALVFIGLFILLAWNIFFVQFHELLFPPGTWTFAYSDSLIRLFPEKFWFDFGVLFSGMALLSGLIVGALGYLLLRRSVRPGD